MSATSSAAKGRLVVPTGRDNSSFSVGNTTGGKMGGGIDNLAHSLKGTSANQKGSSR